MDNIALALLDISIAVLVIATSIPLLKDKIKMNWWYGVRLFRKVYESDENWYTINRYGGRRLILWSVVLIVIVFLILVFPIGKIRIPLLTLAPLIYIIPLIECWRFSRRQ